MHKITLLFTLVVVLLIQCPSHAQTARPISKLDMLKAVKNEKWRTPVKIEDAVKAQEQSSKENTKKIRATELKVSNSNSTSVEEGEAQIAIDPTNPNNLVMSYMDNSTTGLAFPIYSSTNGGLNWTKSSFNAANYLAEIFPTGSIVGGGDPIFAYDKTGKLYFSWIYLSFDQTSFDTAYACMFLATSTNNGLNWTVAPGKDRFIGITALDPLSFESFDNYEGMYDRQWFAVDLTNGPNQNNLYCSFVYFPNMSESPALTGQYIKKKLPANTKFNTSKTQVNMSGSQFGNVVVTNDGKLHVSYADLDQNSVMHAVSNDGGNTFNTPNLVSTGINLFGAQGNGYIHDRENSAVNMVAGSDNNLHIVWSDFPVSPGANYNSYYSRSTDGGNTWSPSVNLSTIFGASNKALMPTVCAYNNRVSIGAYVINGPKVSDYYMATSNNDGSTWGTPTKLSTQSTDFSSASNMGTWFGDYYNAVRTDTKVYNIWADGRNTTKSKMYVSITTEAGSAWPTSITEISPINASFSLEEYYPNPVQDQLTLSFKSTESNLLNIQLCSLDGKIIRAKKCALTIGQTKADINISGIAKGAYLLKILDKDNTQLTRMIVKN
ncbi:MAG: T9SS type A sorting domain-containing protein [Chitinophagaceae bacterium]|nr:T9SS type A sorting domain-containing protein [Chitinophagaceae bacterium]